MEKGKLIGQGRSAEVFEWGQDRILKLFRKGFPKIAIEKEYEISSKISRHLNLGPKVYELIEIDNRLGIIYERIIGVTMMKILMSKPWKAKQEAQKLAELHVLVQQEVDFEIPNNKERLKNNISKTELLSEEIKLKLYTYIDELNDDNILCHGDFHPGNVILSKSGHIIIDWMTATRGNPLADVARTSVLLKFGVVPETKFLEKLIIRLFLNKLYKDYIKHYITITGSEIDQIEKWELPIAAARLIEWVPKEEKEALINFINSRMANTRNTIHTPYHK